MADIELVIKIPESRYRLLQKQARTNLGREKLDEFAEVVLNGIPLPKGHGDLIDRSTICKAVYAEEDNCTGAGMTYDEMDAYNDGVDEMYRIVGIAPTIIEADKESEDKG